MPGFLTRASSRWSRFTSRVRGWFVPRTRTRSELYTVIMRADGFVPPIQISGRGLASTLEKSAWSYACVCAASEAISSLPGVVQTKDERGKWVPAPDHPLSALLESPLGLTKRPSWSWGQLIELVVQQVLLSNDGAFLLPGKVGGRLTALYPTAPDTWRIDTDKFGFPDAYQIGDQSYTPSEVVHIHRTNPSSLATGLSASRVAGPAIRTDGTARDRIDSNLENRISPGLIVSIDVPFGAAGDGLRSRVKDDLIESYRKSSDDGSPLVLPGTAKVLDAPDQSSAIQYKDVRETALAEILAAYRTPAPVISILRDVRYEGYRTAIESWWTISLFPLLRTIYDAITRQAVEPIYGPGVRLWYDIAGSEISLLLLERRVDVAAKLVALGFPANDAAARVDLEMPIHPELSIPNTKVLVAGHAPDLPPGPIDEKEAEATRMIQ